MPMADVPSAAFWIGALAVAVRGTPRAARRPAILTGVAILIRPNLVPLAVFPWLMAVVRCQPWPTAPSGRRCSPRAASGRRSFVAWVNNLLYGSPLTSGYGDLGPAFSLANAVANSGSIRRGGSRARDRSRSSSWSRSGAGAVRSCGSSWSRSRSPSARSSSISSTFRSMPGGTCVSCCRRSGAVPALRRRRRLGRRVAFIRRSRSPWPCSCSSPARNRLSFIEAHDVLGNGIWRAALPRNGAVHRIGTASRRRHPDDAAQRQHPLLHAGG